MGVFAGFENMQERDTVVVYVLVHTGGNGK